MLYYNIGEIKKNNNSKLMINILISSLAMFNVHHFVSGIFDKLGNNFNFIKN